MCRTKYQTCPSNANTNDVDPSFLIDETNVGSGSSGTDKAVALHDEACTNDYIEIAGKCTYRNQNIAKNFFKNIIVISVIVMIQLRISNFLNILQGRPQIVNQIT